MTIETIIPSIIGKTKYEVVSEILKDAARKIVEVKNSELPKLKIDKTSIDIEFDEDNYIEVSTKLIKKLP